MTLTVRTPSLEIAYEAHGDPRGFPVVLLHGFPDDALAWDAVAAALADAGYRALAPYLRGYGPTRFVAAAATRMAQQAAIGQDLLDFIDALALPRVALAGYDWGGRAACITAIVAPARVRGLLTIGGYNVQNTVAPSPPGSAAQERAGTSGISTPSAAAGVSSRTGARSAGSCGTNGRRAGALMTPPSTAPRDRSRTRISWRSSSTPTAIGTAMRPARHASTPSSGGSPDGRPSPFPA